MRIRHAQVYLIVLALTSQSVAYEWRSHNRMAYYGRTLARKAAADSELTSFLDILGERDLDSHAGDPFKDAFIDEDATEMLRWSLTCDSREFPCYMPAFPKLNLCTVNHFNPPLPIALALGLGEPDAVSHAKFYLDRAVKLYKAGKRNEDTAKKRYYVQGAARALGHALHLVQDMGSPQHTRPENHMPYPNGHGWSFHEYWSLDLWDHDRTCTCSHGGLTELVAGPAVALAPLRSRRPAYRCVLMAPIECSATHPADESEVST